MTARLIIDYGADLEGEIAFIENVIQERPAIRDEFPTRWLALELLEDGEDLRVKLAGERGSATPPRCWSPMVVTSGSTSWSGRPCRR